MTADVSQLPQRQAEGQTPSNAAVVFADADADADVVAEKHRQTTIISTAGPKSMVDALERDDPYQALMSISHDAARRAAELSTALLESEFPAPPAPAPAAPPPPAPPPQESHTMEQRRTAAFAATAAALPELLHRLPNPKDLDSHPVATAVACSDSILESLTKIATGGSQASQEIQSLEHEKRDLAGHAQDIDTALTLRKASDQAAQALSAQRYEVAATAIRAYLQHQHQHRLTERAKAYAGEYTIAQLEATQRALKTTLLEDYQRAVQEADVLTLGKLTPLVQMVQLEDQAVELYLRFLTTILTTQLTHAATPRVGDQQKPPYLPMARVYNAAVTILRHHLPMVSHWLHRAKGDAAVVQLVHAHVEQAVTPLFHAYAKQKQLPVCSRNAQQVYSELEARYATGGTSSSAMGAASAFMGGGGGGGSGQEDMGDDVDDGGFAETVGSLGDVDAAMEEAALLLQHAESYTRFIQHTVHEVQKAHRLRYEQRQDERRQERERQEWSTGVVAAATTSTTTTTTTTITKGGINNNNNDDDDLDAAYPPLEILPAHTQLQETVAEIGGYYSSIERSLLLASMQRAFVVPEDDPRQYSPLGSSSSNSGHSNHNHKRNHQSTPGVAHQAVQTSVVESSLYAARRGIQRAFATGHTGTASAMANYGADCLRTVLVEYLSRRAEDWGVSSLKPGEGLLEGSAGIFNATTNMLLRQGNQTVSHAVGGGSRTNKKVEDLQRRHEIQQGLAWACATLNDLDVAAHHTRELEHLLQQGVTKGFPPGTHETQQLELCVKAFGPVAEGFQLASQTAVESLVGVLKPRIRALVTDAVGGDAAGSGATSGFSLGSTTTERRRVGGGGGGVGVVRMNYDLDDEAYQLLEVSEGYMSRLCTCIDDLIMLPLCAHLAPKLSDDLVLGVLGTMAKRLEVSLKKCRFTSLGALSLDSDMRDLLNYAKDRLDAPELSSNVALYRACIPLSRLMQIAKLLTVDDLEDVLDLIGASKRKGQWDLTLDDAKAYLALRVEFESDRIQDLLRIPDGDE